MRSNIPSVWINRTGNTLGGENIYAVVEFMEVEMVDEKQNKEVMIYTLSTCSHCMKLKRFLKDRNIPYDFVDVDVLTGEDRKTVIEEVKTLNPNCTFPTIKINGQVIVGFNEQKIRAALEI